MDVFLPNLDTFDPTVVVFDAFDFERQLIETGGVESRRRPVFVYLDDNVKDRIFGTPSVRGRNTPLH